jgi:hypothetical protein
MNKLLPLTLSLAALALTQGCTTLDSSKIKTSGISAHITVDADGTGKTNVTTKLNADTSSTDFIHLVDGDVLVASVAQSSQPLSESKDILGEEAYLTTFSAQDGDGASYVVAFNRKNDTSAPKSTAVLPKPFKITPPAASPYSRNSSDIVIGYAPSGTSDKTSIELTGDCIQSYSQDISDTGTVNIPKGSLRQAEGKDAPTQCAVSFKIVRARQGLLDAAFQGGDVTATQTRTISITSAP